MRETIGIDLGGDESKLSETPMQAPKEFKTRDFRITPEILEKFGYTKGCAGCEAKIFGTRHQNHTVACRARLEGKIAVDERLKEILERRNQRIGVFKDRSCEKFIRDDPDDTIERAGPPAPIERGEQPQVLDNNNKMGSSNSDDEMKSSSSDDEAEDLPKMEGEKQKTSTLGSRTMT